MSEIQNPYPADLSIGLEVIDETSNRGAAVIEGDLREQVSCMSASPVNAV
jgi:hypothetical protein